MKENLPEAQARSSPQRAWPAMAPGPHLPSPSTPPPTPGSINLYQNTAKTPPSHGICGGFHTTSGELSSRNRNPAAHKTSNIYYLALREKACQLWLWRNFTVPHENVSLFSPWILGCTKTEEWLTPRVSTW